MIKYPRKSTKTLLFFNSYELVHVCNQNYHKSHYDQFIILITWANLLSDLKYFIMLSLVYLCLFSTSFVFIRIFFFCFNKLLRNTSQRIWQWFYWFWFYWFLFNIRWSILTYQVHKCSVLLNVLVIFKHFEHTFIFIYHIFIRFRIE